METIARIHAVQYSICISTKSISNIQLYSRCSHMYKIQNIHIIIYIPLIKRFIVRPYEFVVRWKYHTYKKQSLTLCHSFYSIRVIIFNMHIKYSFNSRHSFWMAPLKWAINQCASKIIKMDFIHSAKSYNHKKNAFHVYWIIYVKILCLFFLG